MDEPKTDSTPSGDQAGDTGEPQTPSVEDRIAKMEAEKADLTEQVKAATDAATAATNRAAELTGQLQAFGAVAAAPAPAPTAAEDPPDLINEPDKALDHYWNKRTGPIIAAQLDREVSREKRMVEVKRPDDWKKYGKFVDELVLTNKIPRETLASPGSYEQLLNLVMSQHIDEIVEERIKDKGSESAADAGKTAGAALPGGSKASEPKAKNEPEFTEQELSILGKLDVDPKAASEASKNVTYDGHARRGEVVH